MASDGKTWENLEHVLYGGIVTVVLALFIHAAWSNALAGQVLAQNVRENQVQTDIKVAIDQTRISVLEAKMENVDKKLDRIISLVTGGK